MPFYLNENQQQQMLLNKTKQKFFSLFFRPFIEHGMSGRRNALNLNTHEFVYIISTIINQSVNLIMSRMCTNPQRSSTVLARLKT